MRKSAAIFVAMAAMLWMAGCADKDPVSFQSEGADSPAGKLVTTKTKVAGDCNVPGCRPGFGGGGTFGAVTPPAPVGEGRIAVVNSAPRSGVGGGLNVVSPDGSNEIHLVSMTLSGGIGSWSPDAKKILYWDALTPGGGPTYIFMISVDNPDNPSNIVQLTNVGGGADSHPSMSPNGKKIAFTRYLSNNPAIYVMNSDGSNVTQLASFVGVRAFAPTWSPDGKKIAFWGGGDAGGKSTNDIYVMNASGGDAVKITNSPLGYYATSPGWSPDGKKIAFTAGDAYSQTPPAFVYVMDADGSNATQLASTAGLTVVAGGNLSWSPDGERIVFQGTEAAYVVNADGSNLTKIIQGGNNVWSPVWSPR